MANFAKVEEITVQWIVLSWFFPCSRVLSLLDISGTDHLTLEDFDPTLLTPSWIPPDRWQSLLSLSTLPGPLEGTVHKDCQ